jgi:hypothetical protein
MARPAENVVAYYNKRGTREQWIKEGKGAIKWTRLSCRSFAANAVRLHPEEESKNEKRQKSADYCVKKSIFSKHYVSPACAGIEFQDRLGFLSFTPRGTPGVGRSIISRILFSSANQPRSCEQDATPGACRLWLLFRAPP